jgi:hypothetical protein
MKGTKATKIFKSVSRPIEKFERLLPSPIEKSKSPTQNRKETRKGTGTRTRKGTRKGTGTRTRTRTRKQTRIAEEQRMAAEEEIAKQKKYLSVFKRDQRYNNLINARYMAATEVRKKKEADKEMKEMEDIFSGFKM